MIKNNCLYSRGILVNFCHSEDAIQTPAKRCQHPPHYRDNIPHLSMDKTPDKTTIIKLFLIKNECIRTTLYVKNLI